MEKCADVLKPFALVIDTGAIPTSAEDDTVNVADIVILVEETDPIVKPLHGVDNAAPLRFFPVIVTVMLDPRVALAGLVFVIDGI